MKTAPSRREVYLRFSECEDITSSKYFKDLNTLSSLSSAACMDHHERNGRQQDRNIGVPKKKNRCCTKRVLGMRMLKESAKLEKVITVNNPMSPSSTVSLCSTTVFFFLRTSYTRKLPRSSPFLDDDCWRQHR